MSNEFLGVMTTRVPIPGKGNVRRSIGAPWDFLALSAQEEDLNVIVFSADQVRTTTRPHSSDTVSGWTYQVQDGQDSVWRWVTRSIPQVIYDGALLRNIKRNSHYKQIRRTLRRRRYQIFNPAFPNKGVIHEYLSTTEANPFIPNTRFVRTQREAMRFLEECSCVFLKPIRGSGGKGIIEIRKESDGVFQVSHDVRGNARRVESMSGSRLRTWLQHVMESKSFLAQKAVRLIEAEQQKIDFRVPLYRDGTGVWRSVGVICKLGRKGSPVTNFHSGGVIIPYSRVEAYQKLYLFPLPLESHMVEAAIIAANALAQKYPTLGVLGIDVGIDDKGDIWLLDFNPRQGRDIMDQDQIKQAMQYTAGFGNYLLRSKGRGRDAKHTRRNQEVSNNGTQDLRSADRCL